MMNARAIAERAMEDKNHRQAADAIQLAIDDIRDFLDEFAEFEEDVTSEEIELLSQMLEKIRRKTPKSREEKIREDLELAIAAEDYEQAAMLRDMLASMSGKNV
jgi:rubrerythrin